MKPLHAVLTGLATFMAALIATIMIVINQPVGAWYYMTYDQRLWFSIGTASLVFIWILVLVIITAIFVKSV